MEGKTVFKGCGLGCLGLIVLLIAGTVVQNIYLRTLTPEQRAAREARASEEAKANAPKPATPPPVNQEAVLSLMTRLLKLQKRLPRPDSIQEQLCPATAASEKIDYVPADYAFIMQFTDHGYEPLPPDEFVPWYRLGMARVQSALHHSKSGADWGLGWLTQLSGCLDRCAYLAVFLPEQEAMPVLNADQKSFRPGVYRGWVILVDAKTMTPLGQTRMKMENSDHVLSSSHETERLEDILKYDYESQFQTSANEAIARLRAHPGSTVTATLNADFP